MGLNILNQSLSKPINLTKNFCLEKPDKDRAVPVNSGNAGWRLKCKKAYYPTENPWQVQLNEKLLAAFFFSREFRYFLALLQNTVRSEQLDMVLKKCVREKPASLSRKASPLSHRAITWVPLPFGLPGPHWLKNCPGLHTCKLLQK